MSEDLIRSKIESKYIVKRPEFSVGDTVSVSTIVREKNKKRIQVFKGIVIAIKGSGLSKTFTVRKISAGIGVEKIFPLNSPNISKIEVVKKGAVRKSKLYYMRKRIGKKALKVNTLEKDIEDLIEDVEEGVEDVLEDVETEVEELSNEEEAV